MAATTSEPAAASFVGGNSVQLRLQADRYNADERQGETLPHDLRRGSPTVNARPKKRAAWNWWYLLFSCEFVAVLWPPFYNRAEPAWVGIPFFYWYQLLWIAHQYRHHGDYLSGDRGLARAHVRQSAAVASNIREMSCST